MYNPEIEIEKISGSEYNVHISVLVADGETAVIVSNQLNSSGKIREIRVDVVNGDAPENPVQLDTGAYTRGPVEDEVQVNVFKNGEQKGSEIRVYDD